MNIIIFSHFSTTKAYGLDFNSSVVIPAIRDYFLVVLDLVRFLVFATTGSSTMGSSIK